MYCPKCRSEFVAGVAWCGNCEATLVDELPALSDYATAEGMAALLADRELAVVMTGVHVEMQRAQRLLAGERIASVIAPEEEGDVEPGLHTRFRLLVDADAIEETAAVFRRLWRQHIDLEGIAGAERSMVADTACPACGSDVPSSAPECPECGLFLGESAEVS